MQFLNVHMTLSRQSGSGIESIIYTLLFTHQKSIIEIIIFQIKRHFFNYLGAHILLRLKNLYLEHISKG